MYSVDNLCVFIDESGDLGFKKKSSRYFVVSYILTLEYGVVNQQVKRLRKRFNRDRRFSGEFKFSDDLPETRNKVLELLCRLPLDIGVFVVDKSKILDRLKDNKNVLYNYLVVETVVSTIISNYDPTRISIIVDKRMTKELVNQFDNYLSQKIIWKCGIEGRVPPTHGVSHKDSFAEPCLQLADYVSGSTYRKFEHSEDKYYDKIRHKITYKKQWGEGEL